MASCQVGHSVPTAGMFQGRGFGTLSCTKDMSAVLSNGPGLAFALILTEVNVG